MKVTALLCSNLKWNEFIAWRDLLGHFRVLNSPLGRSGGWGWSWQSLRRGGKGDERPLLQST